MAKKSKKVEEVNFVRVAVIVGIVAVILIVAMFVSVSITGNVIKQNNNAFGRYNLYTKEEVDRLISSVSGGSNNVYEQMRNLVPVDGRKHVINGSIIASCENTCKSEFGTKCVLALMGYNDQNSQNDPYTRIRYYGCTDTASVIFTQLSCLCEPPIDPTTVSK
jgi:uncharacterized membrane protein